MLLVGSREPQRLDWPRLERAFADAALGRELRSTRVLKDPLALAATWTMGRAGDGALAPRTGRRSRAARRSTPTTSRTSSSWRRGARWCGRPRPRARRRRSTRRWARPAGDVRVVLDGVPALAAGGAARRRVPARAGRAPRGRGSARAGAAASLDAATRREPGRRGRARARRPSCSSSAVARARPWSATPRSCASTRRAARPGRRSGASRSTCATTSAPRRRTARCCASSPRRSRPGCGSPPSLARQERWREAREAIAKAQALDPKAPVDPQLVAFLEQQASAAGAEALRPPRSACS